MILKIVALVWTFIVIIINVVIICLVGSKAKRLEKKEPNNVTGYALILQDLGVLIPLNFGTLAFVLIAIFN